MPMTSLMAGKLRRLCSAPEAWNHAKHRACVEPKLVFSRCRAALLAQITALLATAWLQPPATHCHSSNRKSCKFTCLVGSLVV